MEVMKPQQTPSCRVMLARSWKDDVQECTAPSLNEMWREPEDSVECTAPSLNEMWGSQRTVWNVQRRA